MLHNKFINDYLYYGYKVPEQISDDLMKLPSSGKKFIYTPQEASTLLDKILDEIFEKLSPDKYCIIPISGGWDSRLLLAAAVDRLNISQIKSYSFGTSGQLDYEIGRNVAETLGTEHIPIDLHSIKIDWHQLEETVKEAPWTKIFDAFVNRFCVKRVAGDGDMLLTGFMGDPLFGSHQLDHDDIKEIIRVFVKRQNITGNSTLLEKNYNPLKSIPELPKDVIFNTYDTLDFGIRQANMIAPIVTPLPVMKKWGSDTGSFNNSKAAIKAPFANPEWIQYWAQAPKNLRKDQRLFFKMFELKYPELYRLPAKDYFGAGKKDSFNFKWRKTLFRVQNRLHKHLPKVFDPSIVMQNYLNFNTAFRIRSDYKDILNKSISYLQEESVAEWINFEEMWNEHMSYKADHADAFRVFIGLALNLKVKNPLK